MKKLTILCSLMVAASFLSLSTPLAAGDDTEEFRAYVENANDQYEEAFRNRDAEKIADLYTEDAHVYVPLVPKLEGREDIHEWMEYIFESGAISVKLRVTEAYAVDGVGYELGRYAAMGENGKVIARGSYMSLWRKENGGWKIFRDMTSG